MHALRTFFVACCVSLLAFAGAQGTTELDTARAKFNEAPEGTCREATEICVRLNNVAAVELMLDVLRTWENRGANYLSQGHYRDVVWDGLGRITDLYARKRVEAEMKTNKRSAWTRQWCAELLGIYKDAEFGDSLLKALGDDDIGVQRAAALSLGKCKFTPAVKALTNKVGDKDYILRTNALDALMRIDADAHAELLKRGLKDKDGGVRCALLAVAAQTLPAQCEALSTAAMTDTDWRPRLQAVDNLGAIRTKTSVDVLVRALDDGRPTVVDRAVRRLQSLTGQRFRGRDQWTAWWAANRETFAFAEGQNPTSSEESNTVSYHGVNLASDRVAFMIDVSSAMGETLTSKSMSKASAAHAELAEVFEKLQGRLTFNVFCYAETTRVFEDKGAVELTARNKKKALEFVEEAPRGRQKDIWAAIEAVLEDPELDTAFLLSSGEPDIGTYVHWNRVTWHLADLNRFRKVTFHAIAYTDSNWYRQQLEKIAEVTGGEFRHFE